MYQEEDRYEKSWQTSLLVAGHTICDIIPDAVMREVTPRSADLYVVSTVNPGWKEESPPPSPPRGSGGGPSAQQPIKSRLIISFSSRLVFMFGRYIGCPDHLKGHWTRFVTEA